VVDGQMIKEPCYRSTASGANAWRECRRFYAQVIGSGDADEGLAHA
jgi:hypothetical protein